MRRFAFTDRLTYANVTSTIALVVALGGGAAYAADTIGSPDIIDESILSQDIKNDEVKAVDLANQAVGTDELATGAVRSTDVRNDTLNAGGLLSEDIAQDTLGSQDVADDSLSGADIADDSLSGADIAGASLSGSDVTDDSLGGADIDETSLDGIGVGTQVVSSSSCDPSSTTLVVCATKQLTFDHSGVDTSNVLVVATLDWRGNTGGAAGVCQLQSGTSSPADSVALGETTNTTDAAHQSTATLVASFGGTPLTPLTVSVRCKENESDLRIFDVKLVAIGDIV